MFVFNPNNLEGYKFTELYKNGTVRLFINREVLDLSLQQFVADHLTFTDKPSYITWVSSWKEQYKALTLKSRKLKRFRKKDHWDKTEEFDTLLKQAPIGDLDRLRNIARLMLAIRKEGKIKSWTQRNSLQTSRG